MATKKENLARIASLVRERISAWEATANKYALRMNEDYVDFFTWCADDMFKAQKFLWNYRKLKSVIGRGNLADVLDYLKIRIEFFEKELLCGKLRKSSTSQLGNFAFVLELEVWQVLRKEYLQLIGIVESLK